ncbi:DNA polymerase III subunit chi [Candidatus Kinetoplastibacterium oncopeltii TCC290E]|uniref:DNA polymerase III subunit chi n=1 Tax=Candidatus Kinetoplastidibacterium stringomonadis TCC290E TaxID=1208920 RepID=M1LZ88_9PROT|nr:DNA polymerase III subunit chi [Candidatus Kinetoplastibacterium oncopeltii]AGF48439.1 DNA polymerase III subunit chi [Candidatus Kinetoplastibacterium oncopeltii TCC290E]
MQINFIFGVSNRMNAVCQIINKYYTLHRNIVVYSNEYQILCKLDIMLWTFKDLSFIPHSFYKIDNYCKEEFMIITNNISKTKNMKSKEMLLINMSNIIPLCYNEFESVVEIVSENEQERYEARSRWRSYKKDGHMLTGCHFNDVEYP